MLLSNDLGRLYKHKQHCIIPVSINCDAQQPAATTSTKFQLSQQLSTVYIPAVSFALLTRQSVHVDSLGRQADAHVPANIRRKIQYSVDCILHALYTVFKLKCKT